MASAGGSTKDLNDGRVEALHALLNSLSPGSNSQTGEGKLSAEQVRKLSGKLDEILGPDAESSDGARRNEKGELVNEEGLPIIDINEPLVENEADAVDADQLGNFDDPGVLPLWTLSSAEKARRKVACDRILDTLEEEEHFEQTREAEAARARWHEEMEKRKEAAKTEIDNLKRARELQKKMGKALLRNVVESKERAEQEEKAEMEKADREVAAAKKKSLKPKKSVSFADEHVEDKESIPSKGKDIDWGDVAPGRLRTQGQNSLLTKDHMDKLPMKMHVVERHPRAMRSPEPPAQEGDSDDESVDGSLAAADSNDGEIIHPDPSGSEDEGHDSPLVSGLEDSEDDLPGDEEHDDWGGEDFDYARHQREIALEYYEKRKTIGTEVSGAMRAHTHDEDKWNQPEVPLEATLASPSPKPISRFKAEHLLHPNGSSLASHSLGGSVLSSHSSSLKHTVRMGKFQDGKLVGGEDGESDGDVDTTDESTRAMLEMLKKGEVTNAGPAPLTATEVEPNWQPSEPAVSAQLEVLEQPKPSKMSKFKMSLAVPGSSQRNAAGSSTNSLAGTPVSHVNRSSPKMSGNNSPLSPGPKVLERQIPGMIVDSPSFRPPTTTRQQAKSPARESLSTQYPAFHSVILESPSFQPPSGSPVSTKATVVASPPASRQSPPALSAPLRSGVIERRPPTVVSARVTQTSSGEEPKENKQKASRFKAARSR